MSEPDVLVVGSGAAGVHAALPLVEAGLRVRLVDYGNRDELYAPRIPARPWSELRRTDERQHEYFLGERFEGIPLGELGVGAQLTPPRAFIARDAERLLPLDSATFVATQSLAQGGLASGWGAGVFPFDEGDLEGAPLTLAELAPHHDALAEHVGVCGERDDLLPFLGECPSLMPALEVDSASQGVLRRYERRRAALQAAGFHLGVTRLAACSREHRGRGPHPQLDMDYWSDAARAVYRPRWTLEELQQRENFELLDRRLALRFEERGGGVELVVRQAQAGGEERHRARALVLAAGALGSARIALRSLDLYDRPVPLLCNPYTYVPLLHTSMLGRAARDRRHSLAQLTAFYVPPDGGGRYVQAQLYSYRSLLLFKLIKELPFARRDALRLLRLLQPLLGILGIHHRDDPGEGKSLTLRAGEGPDEDRLELVYQPSALELRRQRADEKRMLAHFRKLGCLPLRRRAPGHGASIHYAGCLPMRAEEEGIGCDARCRLFGTRAVHVADGAVFPALPAKGLTFSMMANARRVGSLLAEALR